MLLNESAELSVFIASIFLDTTSRLHLAGSLIRCHERGDDVSTRADGHAKERFFVKNITMSARHAPRARMAAQRSELG